MKRKVKRYDEGGGVFDNIKEGLSRVFRRNEDSPKFSELESVGGAGRRQKTIEEQIKGHPGREIEGKEFAPYRRAPEPEKGSTLKPEPAPSKGGTTYTNEDYSGDKKAVERDVMDVKPEKEAKPAKIIKAAPKAESKPSLRAAPTNAAAKQYEPSSKPIKEAPALPPAKMADKKVEPKPLPGKPEPKSKVTPYSLEKKISKEEEAEAERGKRMEAEAAAQQKKNKEEAESKAKTRAGTPAKTPEIKTGIARTRAGTPVKSQSEPSAEAKAKSMSSLAAKIKKQDEENRFNFSPSKSPNRSYKSGGSVSSASSRGDGIAMRGKTRGRIY
jgi:hypothetical protein